MHPLIVEWHKQGLGAAYGLDTDMVMGCPLWGEPYTTYFRDYCLPSLRANGVPLRSIVLFTDGPTEQALAGLDLRIIRLPEPLVGLLYIEPGHKYPLLAAAHNLLIRKAADIGAGFHMLVADTVYSDRYFDAIKRLSRDHDAIAHTGFQVQASALPVLRYFRRDKRLIVWAEALGRIGWDHMDPQWASWSVDGQIDQMPNSHYIHYRGRDHVRVHCAHQSAAWIANSRCLKVKPELGGTVDSELPRYMAGEFYQPRMSDQMCYVVIGDGAGVPTPRVPFAKFAKEIWRFIGGNRAFLPYFQRPCVVPVPEDASAPDDAELDARFTRMMARLEEYG